MQVVQPNVIQQQQQRSGVDNLLARLLALTQIGGTVWQGIKSGDEHEAAKMYPQLQGLAAVMRNPAYASDPQEAEQMLIALGYSPEVAKTLAGFSVFRQRQKDRDTLQSKDERDFGAPSPVANPFDMTVPSYEYQDPTGGFAFNPFLGGWAG